MRQLFMSIWVVFLAVLVAGCTPAVSPEDVYHSDVVDPKLGGGKNIVVEYTLAGTKVSGSEVSVLTLVTNTSFRLETEPEGTNVKYTIGEIALDSSSGSFIVKANIKLGENSNVSARLPMEGATRFSPKSVGLVPGSSGSQNVSVKINKDVGYTVLRAEMFGGVRPE
jgi:hypothetical protein